MPSVLAKTRRVVLVAYPNVTLMDVAGPAQVFASALLADSAHYEVQVVSPEGGLVRTDTGIMLGTTPISEVSGDPIDTLLVHGGLGVFEAAKNAHLVSWIQERAERARRVGSTCMGAFVMAATGLLTGRRTATHWRWCTLLQQRYPEVIVNSDRIFIRDGKYWSSAGVSAGIDLALALIEEDLGHSTALDVARSLVLFLKRSGGQSQFSSALSLQTSDKDGTFDRLHAWMAENLHADLRVDRLAEVCGMSPRSFIRHYKAKTGVTPARSVEAIRIEIAREMLERDLSTVSQVAARCGFGDDERLRRTFARILGVSPAEYRKRFGRQGPN